MNKMIPTQLKAKIGISQGRTSSIDGYADLETAMVNEAGDNAVRVTVLAYSNPLHTIHIHDSLISKLNFAF